MSKQALLWITVLSLAYSSQSRAQSYCSATHANGSYYINSFTTSNGTQNISNTGSGVNVSASCYEDYTNTHIAKAQPGDTLSFAITTSNYYTYKRVWVDWNRDYDFDDAGETIYSANLVGTTSASGNIVIPAGHYGKYRMRVQTRYYGSIPSSCGYYLYGETEDYAIHATIGNDLELVGYEDVNFCVGSQSVKVWALNIGNNNITSFKIDGGISGTTFSTYTYSGTLAPDSSVLVTLGNHTFVAGQIDTVEIYSYNVNGGADSNTTNDTIAELIQPAMNGTYTIGGSSPDYSGFTSALSALSTRGICGAVTFHVRQGTYTEALSIGTYTGSTASHNITFKSDPANTSEVVLRSSSDVITFDDASHIVFDDIMIKQTSSNNAVYFQDVNEDIILRNCTIKGWNVSTTSAVYATIYDDTEGGEDIVFENNVIKYGSYGIYLRGSSGDYEGRIDIIDNHIDSAYRNCIYLYYTDSSVIEGNILTPKILYSAANPIYLYYADEVQVLANEIYMENSSNYGIYMYECDGTTSDHVTIANNFIFSENYSPYQVYSQYSDHVDFFYNTMRLENSSSGSIGAYWYYGTNIVMQNNIFANMGSGYAYQQVPASNITTSDYNCFYTNGTYLTYYSGSRTDLASHQSASSKETNSVSVDPVFLTVDGPDPNALQLDGGGTSVSVTTDLNGVSRPGSSPDIGCIEFTPTSDDVSLNEILDYSICPGNTNVDVAVHNAGSNAITSAKIGWKVMVNGGSYQAQTPFNFSGSIGSGVDTTLNIGTYNFIATSTYKIVAWVDSVNGNMDGYAGNDTIVSDSTQPSMSGIYTVGGTSPDYLTLTAAWSDLTTRGVCADVTLHVRTGIYTGSTTINDVPGSSAKATITVKPDPSTSGTVSLQNTWYPLYFLGGSYIAFEDLEIEATGAYPVVYFNGPCDHISFRNNDLYGYQTSSTSTWYSIFYKASTAFALEGIEIEDNSINYGSYGIYFYSSNGTRSRNNSVIGNEILDFSYIGAYFYYDDSLTFEENFIADSGIYNFPFGFYGYYTDFLHLERNDIEMSNYYGIYLLWADGAAGDSTRVVNNMVTIKKDGGSTNNSYGIYVYYGDYMQIANNSVHMVTGGTNSYAFYDYYGNYKHIVNNNFVANNMGYAVGEAWIGNRVMDFNNYYSNGSFIGYYAGARTLSSWKTATSKDANSISVDPHFFSDRDLHSRSTGLDSAGTTLSYVSDDFDGQTRSTTDPDIGADEFVLIDNDAALGSITSNSVCPGYTGIEAIVRNDGLNDLTATTINWTVAVNGGFPITQSPFNFSGNLATGEDTTVIVGYYTFTQGNSYVLTAWTDSVNGVADNNNNNDTAMTPGLTPSLSGTYTIGGANPDYSTIDAAVSDLQNTGVCGNVVMVVRGGNYNEALSIGAIPGVSATRTVTFLGDTNATTQARLTNNTTPLTFTGASYITFENMTIKTVFGPRAVHFSGDNSNITLREDSIVGYVVNSTSSYYATVLNDYGASLQNHDITIDNNVILEGSYGVYMYGYGTATNMEDHLIVTDNHIEGFYYTGIYTYYQDTAVIEGNDIYHTDTYTSPYGCYLNYTDNMDLGYNHVEMKSGYGIYMYYCDGNSSEYNNIYNNTIVLGGPNNYTSYGLMEYYGQYINYYHNSVHIYGSLISGYATYLYAGAYKNNENNNYVSSSGMPAIYIHTSTGLSSDHNNYYTTGSVLGYRFGNRPNLSQWQTAIGQDNNSVSADPNFLSDVDLHANSALLDSANNYVGVMYDIDGEARDTAYPDMGADEFLAVDNDASITEIISDPCPGLNDVDIRLRNFGAQNLTSTNIHWSVAANGGSPVVQTALSWTGNLNTGEDTVLTVGTYNFAATGYYDLTFWVDSANSVVDGNSANDTITSDSLSPRLSGVYTLGGLGSDFASFAAAKSQLYNTGVCGDVIFDVQGGSYSERLELDGDLIDGLDSSATITYRLDTSSSGGAELSFGSYPLHLLDMHDLIIEGLEFTTTGASYAAYVSGSADNLEFYDNTFNGYQTTSTSSFYSVFFRSYNYLGESNFVFEGNSFYDGSRSIWMDGSGTFPGENFEIVDNHFSGFSYGAIVIEYKDSVTISGNIIEDPNSSLSTFYGINGQYINHYNIHNNRIQLNDVDGYGIYLVYSDGSFSQDALVYNNEILISESVNSGSNYGIYTFYCDYVGLYYNSIHVTGGSASSAPLYLYYGTNHEVKNNNLANSGSGYAYYRFGNQVTSSDYNNLYASGTNVGYYIGNRTSLSAWQSATGRDANSVSSDPLFVANDDLHANSVDLDSAASPITGITLDFDGDSRNSTHPDIGVDEFTPIDDDAGILDLFDNMCAGQQNVDLEIKNFGANTITNLKIDWTVSTNGATPIVQTSLVLTSAITSGQDTVVTLGSITYNEANDYEIIAFVDSVNGIEDNNHLNDTLSTGIRYPALNGTYVVGGSNPDFFSITDLDSNINNRGICGSVTILITPGTYNEQLYLDDIEGNSNVNTIDIRPDTGSAAFNWYHVNAPLRLTGMTEVTIENLTIENTGTAPVIWLDGDNDNINILNNDLTGSSNSGTGSFASVIYSTESTNGNSDNVTIDGNVISNHAFGINMHGRSNGSNDLLIHDNDITGFNYAGIQIQYEDGMEISDNFIENDGLAGGIYGMLVYYSDQIEISANEIHLDNNGSHGIYLVQNDGIFSNYNRVWNNMVSIEGATGLEKGIYVNNSDYTRIAYNSVGLHGSANSSYGLYHINGISSAFLNNNVANKAGGYAMYTNCLSCYSSNNNNLYSTGSNVGFYGGNRASLGDWVSATGKDGQSVSSDPYFVAADDLHALSADLDSGAAVIAGMTTDFDGETRSNSYPDIGADEFTPLDDDAGIVGIDLSSVCPGTQDVIVTVRNFGLLNLDTVRIAWSVSKNGGAFVPQTTVGWGGSLSTGSHDDNVNLGSLTFDEDTTYAFRVYTFDPNGVADLNGQNDTVETDDIAPAMTGVYTIGGLNPDFSSLFDAGDNLSTRGVCGAVKFFVRQGTYNDYTYIYEVEGASMLNNILFTPDTNNTQDVVINHWGAPFNIYGGDHITIEGFTLGSTSTSPAVRIENNSNHITIQGNHLVGTTSNSSWGGATVLVRSTSSAPQNNLVIRDNVIENGSYGVYMIAYNGADSDNVIEHNEITGFGSYAIYASGQDNMTIQKNDIIDSGYVRGSQGIYLTSSDYATITQNRIVLYTNGGTGILLANSDGDAVTPSLIANNNVYVESEPNYGGGLNGIYLSYNDYSDVYFNSVDIEGSAYSWSGALYFLGGSSVNIKNNNLVNNAGSYAMYFGNTSVIPGSDFNNLYTNGTLFCYRYGNRANLSAWRSYVGRDYNSVSGIANYLEPENLIPNNVALNGTGISIPGINVDFSDSLRASTPDIGAFEFSPRLDDAGVTDLAVNQVCSGTQDVVFELRNFGGDTLTQVDIDWFVSVNGGSYNAQSTFSWNGTLIPGSTEPVAVGTLNFSADSTYEFTAHTSTPNGVTDELFSNDTLDYASMAISLSGTYTLGGSSPSFAGFTELNNALDIAGVCGPVTIKVRPGTYQEHLDLDDIDGISSTNSLTIVRDTGAGVATLMDTVVPLTLTDMRHVTIRGLTIRALDTTGAIALYGVNDSIWLDSNHVVGQQVYTTSPQLATIYESAAYNDFTDNLRITHNEIEKGSYGIYLQGRNSYTREEDNEISGNDISGFFYKGVQAYYQDDLVFEDNDLTSDNNYSSPTGVDLTYVSASVERNRIEAEGTSAAVGLYMYRGGGTSGNEMVIANNMIYAGGPSGTGRGVYFNQTSYIDFFFNTVLNNAESTSFENAVVKQYGGADIEYKNNVLANFGEGSVYRLSGTYSSDFNDLYTNGAVISQGDTTLADWVSSQSMDGNSVSVDPIFDGPKDLHASHTHIDSAGLTISGFSTDIDGDIRNINFPDMGADEFDLVFDVGVVALLDPVDFRGRQYTSSAFDSAQTIEIVVRNFGPQITDIPVTYEFYGNIAHDTIFGTKSQGQYDTIVFSTTVDLDTVGIHEFHAFTAMAIDQYTDNDTLLVELETIENDEVLLPLMEDFEGAYDSIYHPDMIALEGIRRFDWTTNGGRLRINSGEAVSGERALTMDRAPFGRTKKSKVVYTLNLKNYTTSDSIYLDFDFVDHGDERHRGDSVWVRGNDTLPWIGIYDMWRSRKPKKLKEVRDMKISDILASKGQAYSSSFQLRFGHEDNGPVPSDGRTIDNINVRIIHPYDVELSNVKVDYREIPIQQGNDIFTATVANAGYLTLDSVGFKVTINNVSDSIYLDSLAKGGDAVLSLNHLFNPAMEGDYSVEIQGINVNTDGDLRNDTSSLSIHVSDSILARENGIVDTTFGFNGTGGEMSQQFFVNSKDTITGVAFFLNFPPVGDTVTVHLYDDSSGVPGMNLGSSNSFVFPSNAGKWYYLEFQCLQVVDSGNYHIVVEQDGSNNLTMGLAEDNFRTDVAHFRLPGGNWNTLESAGYNAIYSMRMVLDQYDIPVFNVTNQLCTNSDTILLEVTPPGGTFSGPGVVNDSLFTPDASGVGTFEVMYTILNARGCVDSVGHIITVDTVTPVSFTNPADICETATPATLTTGIPAGGFYSGTGIVGGTTFDPSGLNAGSYTLSYKFSNASNCSDSATAQIVVIAAPAVQFASLPDFCESDTGYVLTEGSPAGGIYSGPGVTAGVFDASSLSNGNHTLEYTFTDTNSCSNVAAETLEIFANPEVDLGDDIDLCGKQTDTLDAGNPGSTYAWNNGAASQQIVVQSTDTFIVTVTDVNGCSSMDTAVVTYTAICVGFEDEVSSVQLEFYPNPTDGKVFLKLGGIEGRAQLRIRDFTGSLVESIDFTQIESLGDEIFDLNGLSSGVYLFELSSEQGAFTRKVTLR